MPGIGLGRDPERTPMQWDATPNAGFCPPSIEPWLPIANDYGQVNVATQRQDDQSMLSLTRALLQLRRVSPALSIGSYTSIQDAPEDCFVYLREFDQQRYLIALNFSSEKREVRLPKMGKGHVLISTHLDREGTVDLSSFSLRGNEGVVVEIGEQV